MPDGTTPAVNPLATGFYTVSDAVRFIEGASARRVRGWVKGYREAGPPPVISSDRTGSGPAELSFLDLIEVRFVDHFGRHGVRMKTLRIAGKKLREEFSINRPFASDRVKLLADKADVFLSILVETGKEESDDRLLSLTSGNYVMAAVIAQSLLPGIEFSKKDHLARKWAPEPTLFSEIVIDPRVAYGRPAGPSGVPTERLAQTFAVHGCDLEAAASWFDVSILEAQRAVEFESLLTNRGKAAS